MKPSGTGKMEVRYLRNVRYLNGAAEIGLVQNQNPLFFFDIITHTTHHHGKHNKHSSLISEAVFNIIVIIHLDKSK
jgi:hypothetical protein